MGKRRFTARYQASMLRSLKEVQADDSVIGFYQGMTLGSFFNQSLVDTQAIHQEKLRHGGIVIVHGTSAPAPERGIERALSFLSIQTSYKPHEVTRLSWRSA